MEDKPERDYASGERAEFSDLELDPEIELLNQVSADAVSIPVEIEPETNIFADPEPAGPGARRLRIDVQRRSRKP